MKIKRKFGNSDEGVELHLDISDDEVVKMIADKSVSERVVFFEKLLKTDISKTFPLNLLNKIK